MYFLRRGSRTEVSSAVTQLLTMCDVGMNIQTEDKNNNDVTGILNDIRSAGLLFFHYIFVSCFCFIFLIVFSFLFFLFLSILRWTSNISFCIISLC